MDNRCVGVAIAGLSASVAFGATVDPGSFVAGANISGVSAEVTLSAVQINPFSGFILNGNTDVFAVDPRVSPLGQPLAAGYADGNSFGHAGVHADSTPGRSPEWSESSVEMRADFSSLATSVSIDIIGNNGIDFGFLEAYTAGGTLIQRVQNAAAISSGLRHTLTINAANIGYIIAAGVGGDTVVLDNLQVTLIPLPPAVTMAGAGLIGLGVLRAARRR